ncbi:hypothetical protein E8E14_002962 [Neopestalotiopsis sp. 37M]|nr:hypothetical protein E8E14_002962 [Neopestalotiopsis sp. 37M]
MGWLWASSSSAPKGTTDENRTAAAAAPTPPEPKYSDPEIAKFMAQIQSEFGSEPSEEPQRPSPSSRAEESRLRQQAAAAETTSESPWRSLWGPAAQSETEPSPSSGSSYTTNTRVERDAARPQSRPQRQHPDQLDPISESLLPTTMSCRNALDAAFYCQSPGGQWNAVYREGAVRSCSQHWDDLFFCMRTRPMTGKVKEDAIRDHYRARELAKYGGGKPNSTDVWESRDRKVEPGQAFTQWYDPPTLSDEEWWAMEIRRRRAIQEALATEKSD